MEVGSMPFLLVTANVGSVFEDPSRLLKPWIKEFLSKIALLRPQFLALHLQEVGGKTYEKSMEYVQEFIKELCESDELSEYNRIRIYLDEDYNSAEHFTALGNIYFIHQTLNTVKIWNFLTHEWEAVEGKCVYTGNIEAISTKEKAKFPQHFFPECKWSRKGFLRTRWELNCTVIDLVNIHLFHDASNLAACEEFPSVYCKTRRRALVHTLERFHTDIKNGLAPYFLFGDFNFRCDTEGVIKKLTEDLTAHRVQTMKNDNTKVHYRNTDGENVLTVGKKEFNHADHQTKFKESWLQQFDRELEPLREVLVEYPITFPPSYPYEEDPDMPKNYMSTRCPAWCDRIVMSPSARDLIIDEAFSSTDYNIIGENVCMGDHKPVFLSVHVKTLQGTIRCCSCQEHANPPNVFDLNNVVEKHVDVNNDVIDTSNDVIKIKHKQNAYYCLYSSKEFNSILFECRKLINKIDNNRVITSSSSSASGTAIKRKTENLIHNNNDDDTNNRINNINNYPLVSINITDTDNYNVCMCPMYVNNSSNNDSNIVIVINDDDGNKIDRNANNENIVDMDESICPDCRNIIKKQPLERRCKLISKRLMLTNNIIVNRIDTHYLNTSYIDNRFEPYTPESVESHSPIPDNEYDNNINVNNLLLSSSEQSLPNNNLITPQHSNYHRHSSLKSKRNSKESITISKSTSKALSSSTNTRGVVSPKQLKSRLENLQRSSFQNDNRNDVINNDDDNSGNNNNRCNKKHSKSICYEKSCCLIC